MTEQDFLAGKVFIYTGHFSLLRNRDLRYNVETGKVTAFRVFKRTTNGVVSDEISIDEYWFEQYIDSWFGHRVIQISRHLYGKLILVLEISREGYGKLKSPKPDCHLKEAA